jgi:hypothetical protein
MKYLKSIVHKGRGRRSVPEAGIQGCRPDHQAVHGSERPGK